jgi:hypothetical protein
MILNMFRASLCSASGGQLYIYSIWYYPTGKMNGFMLLKLLKLLK